MELVRDSSFFFDCLNHLLLSDIDWEFPNFYENRTQDKPNFVYLLQDLKRAMGSKLVTCAISSGAYTKKSYDWPKIFQAVDFVNLMTYDLYGSSWSKITGLHTGLYKGKFDMSEQNVDSAVRVVLNSGIDRRKLVMGIGTYGASFKLDDPNRHGIGSPASEDPNGGTMKYFDICSKLKRRELKYQYDDDQKSAYAYAGTL